MNRITTWLQKKLSRAQPPLLVDQATVREIVKPKDIPNDDHTIASSFDPAVPGRIESEGPGKNILMPNKYTEGHAATDPELKILDLSSPDVNKSTGFNPYDTAVLRKKGRP